tara:strand:- start:10941 stop:11171 length:231 start_codon:yes stop_codon:yes gene_type:complete
MKDKHIASEDEISRVLLEMRGAKVESMVLMWNEISVRWSVDSVSQVHRSLQDSGHIQMMVSHILESKSHEIQEAVS